MRVTSRQVGPYRVVSKYCEYFHREQGYDEKDPMRRVGADEEGFRGGKHDEEGLVPDEECFPTRKTDEKA
jgi:hypothetical protein